MSQETAALSRMSCTRPQKAIRDLRGRRGKGVGGTEDLRKYCIEREIIKAVRDMQADQHLAEMLCQLQTLHECIEHWLCSVSPYACNLWHAANAVGNLDGVHHASRPLPMPVDYGDVELVLWLQYRNQKLSAIILREHCRKLTEVRGT